MTKDKSIFIKNIYYMLSYAYSFLERQEYENIASEKFDNIHNLFALILSSQIGKQLKQGLYREYIDCKEDLSVVRGKINMEGTIRNQLARKMIVTCEYDVLLENNIFNQILKIASFLLIKHPDVDDDIKATLKKEMLFFSNVDNIDPSTIHWSALRFQRNNYSYRMLIDFCHMFLDGMLLTTEEGEHKLASFINQKVLNDIYEKFILEYYAKEWPEVNAKASQVQWVVDDGFRDRLPHMQSDITLTKGNKVLIIDAKYYKSTTQSYYGSHTIDSDNLYQIFTYVKNKAAQLKDSEHTVSGMLLYAATDEDIQPDNTYQMSGNQISVKTLDLNRDFEEIRAQLDAIIQHYFSLDTIQ